MTDSPITLFDIATFAAIAGSVFSISLGSLKILLDYISAKFGNKMTIAEQSAQCRFDHRELHGVLTAQNANIAKMLEQNGKQLEALAESNYAANLRHEMVLGHLKEIKTEVTRTQVIAERNI